MSCFHSAQPYEFINKHWGFWATTQQWNPFGYVLSSPYDTYLTSWWLWTIHYNNMEASVRVYLKLPKSIPQQLTKPRQTAVRMAGAWKWTQTTRRDVNSYSAKLVLNTRNCGFWHPWSTVDLTIKFSNLRSNSGLTGNNKKGLIKKVRIIFCADIVCNKKILQDKLSVP
jgi:hypothetical protein